MRLPFTVEQFLGVFREYNHAIWPGQMAAYVLGAAAVVLILRKSRASDRVVFAILAAFWLWTGIMYHVVFFSRINQAAYVFGGLFIVQGLMTLGFGTAGSWLSLRFTRGFWPFIGVALILYAMVVYPLIGLALGHPAAELPWFGVTPCPTTIFTIGVLLCAKGRGRLLLLVVPLLWSVIGGSAATVLQVPQDYGLIVAGILGVIYAVTLVRRPARYDATL